MKNLTVIGAMACVLSGCLGVQYMDTTYNPEVPQPDKAVVVMRSLGVNTRGDEDCVETTWKNVDTQRYFKTSDAKGFFSGAPQATPQIYVVEPGHYSLNALLINESPWFGPRKTIYSNDLSNVAGFTVKPGDVVYVGDVFIDAKKSFLIAKAIKIEDAFDSVKYDLGRENPEIAGKLRKELIQLSSGVEAIKKISRVGGGLLEQRRE